MVGRFVIVDVCGWYPLPGGGQKLSDCQSIISHHFCRDDDRTIGVMPIVNKFRVLLRFTILNIIEQFEDACGEMDLFSL